METWDEATKRNNLEFFEQSMINLFKRISSVIRSLLKSYASKNVLT